VKVRKLTVTETDANGQRIKRPSTKFYAVFIDWSAALRRLPLLQDLRASETLARIVGKLNDIRGGGDSMTPALAGEVERMPPAIRNRLAGWGILSASRLAAGKPLAEHVADWKTAMLAKGNTNKHAELVTSRAGKAFAACNFKAWGDIFASKLQSHVAGLREDRRKADGTIERGLSAQTFNFYLQAVKQFAVWMVRDGRASESPLAHLQGLNVRTDRRHDRRALSADELRWLLDVTEHRPERFGMTGAARAMLYRLALGSGLRAAELRSLTRGSFALEGDDPSVTVGAAYSKHRREDVQPIRLDLAAAMKTHLAGKMPNAPAFNMPRSEQIVIMFRADLTDARTAWLESRRMPASPHRTAQDASGGQADTFLAYVDGAGRYADFHALRHTFITGLVTGGVNPKVAQTLARHSTITLTMDRYTHLYAGNLSAALDVLPDLSAPARQTVVATGTDGRMVGENPPCQNAVNPVSPPVSLKGAALSSLAESCGVNKQLSAGAESSGKTGRNRAFTGGNGVEPPKGIESTMGGVVSREFGPVGEDAVLPRVKALGRLNRQSSPIRIQPKLAFGELTQLCTSASIWPPEKVYAPSELTERLAETVGE